jgi:hypothetical protein
MQFATNDAARAMVLWPSSTLDTIALLVLAMVACTGGRQGMEYVIPGIEYEDGTIQTFEVHEIGLANVDTLEKLLMRGESNARDQRDGYLDRAASRGETWALDGARDDDYDENAPDEHRHRWAWNYARHQLTDYDRLVDHFSAWGSEWPLCEACQGIIDSEEGGSHGLDAGCEDCAGSMEAQREAGNEAIALVRLAIARWAKQQWPGLEIDEDGFWSQDLTIALEVYLEPEEVS